MFRGAFSVVAQFCVELFVSFQPVRTRRVQEVKMMRSPNKIHHSNPDLSVTKQDDTPNNMQRKRKRSEEDFSFALEKLEQSFSSKINQIILELRAEVTDSIAKLNDNINCTLQKEMANLTTVTSEIKTEINELRSECSGFRAHILDLNTKYKNLESELSSLKDSCEFQYKEQSDIKKCLDTINPSTINNVSDKVTDLQDKIDSMEQQARQNNIEICNIPEKRGENLLTLVETIGTTIKCQLDKKDIVSIHRVPHARKEEYSRPKNIIVKLCSRILRDNFLSAYRLSKGLKTDQLDFSGPPRNIYINEHLTLRNKQLFRKCREAAKKHNCKYVWIKNATVLARVSDTSPIFAIRNENDICKLRKTSADVIKQICEITT